jgi:hypothetical protein
VAKAADPYTPRLDVPQGDASTTVALAIAGPDDVLTACAVHPAGGPTVWEADPITLTGGEYRLYWTVTGPGQQASTTQVMAVDPDPDAIPDGFSFATTGDLAAYTGQPIPARARRLLIDASREIERLTKTAVYAVGVDGRPTEPQVRAAFIDATCELVLWWAETGTETGARALFQSASIAGVSLGFGGQAATNPQADRVGPKVWTILLGAGLVGAGGVKTYG